MPKLLRTPTTRRFSRDIDDVMGPTGASSHGVLGSGRNALSIVSRGSQGLRQKGTGIIRSTACCMLYRWHDGLTCKIEGSNQFAKQSHALPACPVGIPDPDDLPIIISRVCFNVNTPHSNRHPYTVVSDPIRPCPTLSVTDLDYDLDHVHIRVLVRKRCSDMTVSAGLEVLTIIL